MNVMKEAHKQAKALIVNRPNIAYRLAFRLALVAAHKDYKAMQAKKNDQIQDMIFQANTFIRKLESYLPLAKGYIVTVGEHRVCSNAEVGHMEHILKVPAYDHIEDARYYASRVQNGKKEGGQVEVWADRIRWEIQEQKNLIQTLQNI